MDSRGRQAMAALHLGQGQGAGPEPVEGPNSKSMAIQAPVLESSLLMAGRLYSLRPWRLGGCIFAFRRPPP